MTRRPHNIRPEDEHAAEAGELDASLASTLELLDRAAAADRAAPSADFEERTALATLTPRPLRLEGTSSRAGAIITPLRLAAAIALAATAITAYVGMRGRAPAAHDTPQPIAAATQAHTEVEAWLAFADELDASDDGIASLLADAASLGTALGGDTLMPDDLFGDEGSL